MIIFDNKIYINQHPVLRINYDIDIRLINNELLFNNIDKTVELARIEYEKGLCKKSFIILVDFNKLKRDTVDISKIKIILKYVLNKYISDIEKCVIYNYNIFWKFLISMIMSIIDTDAKKKICFRKKLDI